MEHVKPGVELARQRLAVAKGIVGGWSKIRCHENFFEGNHVELHF